MTECERLVSEGIVSQEFLEEEVRCEYKVSSEMKKVWAIQLDLLQRIIEVCQQHKLKAWLGGGSLLGAIRHHGVIPWDDDIDVFMPREDYDRLLKLDESTFSEPYFLQTPLNDKGYYCAFARLRNSNTQGGLNLKGKSFNNGIYVDIFPIDGIKSSMRMLYLKTKWAQINNIIGHAYAFNINPNWMLRLVHKVLHWPFVPYNPKMVFKYVNWLLGRYPWSECSKVGLLVYSCYSLEKNVYNKEDFEETIWVPFEYLKAPIPKGYDGILKVVFGDYMKFPPKEERGLRHRGCFSFNPDVSYKEMDYS